MVKFDLEADRERVMHGGPWMLFDHYLIVRPWSPEFVASATKVDSTIVWIRFPGFGVMFYDESVLLTIASAIGKPVKVELNTLNMTRGRFARVCVEINLEEPVVGRFFLNGVWYNVEYEGLHLLCSSCGCYGHVLRNCPHAARSESMATGVGEKETTEQPPRVPTHSEGSAAQTGEKSDPHVKGGIAPDPHGDWMIVKRRNQKHNFGKPQGRNEVEERRFGDRNTSFFHAQTLARRRRNKIQGLFLPDGSWHTDPGVLKTEAVRFYRELFSIDNEQESLDMHTGVPPGLGVEAQLALTAPVTKEEVRRAVMSMKSYKAPGPDGFQPFFFKQYWPIVGDELWRTVKDAFRLGFSEVSLLETQMVLIPKVDHPVSLKEFRPISLCNVAWKVISKVLVARLRPFLQDVIGPFQGSFIPRRRTRDHSIIAQEAFHFVRKEGSGVGSLAVKIDLEKAYDRVRWDFLESTLV
uniref:Transposon TX1 uncharacterized n=1 Tax=Cajanus cajan TaxID=3821 RepID=A0A151R5M6_CAJCA|nr:Transposon TX1 uncharacterized [Cajanus cajan]